MTIEEASVVFVEQLVVLRNLSRASAANHRCTLHQLRVFLGPGATFDVVTPENLQAFFVDGRLNKAWSAATFTWHRNHLRAFCAWAMERALLGHNPMLGIKPMKLTRPLPKSLPKNQAIDLVDAAAAASPYGSFRAKRDRAIIATFVFTGLRRNELIHLRMSDVDLVNKTLFVKEGKGGKDRLLPIAARLAFILSEYVAAREREKRLSLFFFVSVDGDIPICDTTLRRLVKRITQTTGIKFHLHLLRHTFATLMLEGGCDLNSLRDLMGHTDIKTTTLYLSASPEHLRAQVQKHPLNLII